MPKPRPNYWLPLIYLVAGIAWVLGSDFMVSRTLLGTGAADAVSALKGVIFVGLSALLIFIVVSRQPEPSETRPLPPEKRGALRPVLIFLLAALGIGAAAWVIYRQQSDMVRFEAGDDLSTIGELKAERIEQWLADRTMAMERAGRNAVLVQVIRDDEAGHTGNDARIRSALLESIRASEEYGSLQLVALDGRSIDVAGDAVPITARLRRLMAGALVSGRVVQSDLYIPEGDARGEPVIDFVVAVSDPAAPGDHNVAVLIARASAADFLYPVVTGWPSHTQSGESILFRREQSRAVFLTPPALEPRRPLVDAISLSNTSGAIVRIMGGDHGPIEAVDYRGVPVLEFGREIRGTGWYLVSKMDRAELFDPLRRLMLMAITLCLIALSAAAALVALWWRGERLTLSLRVTAAERRAAVLEEHFALAGRFINDAVLLYDAEGRILEVNDRAEAMYGHSRYEMLGMTIHDLSPPGTPEAAQAREHFAAAVGTGVVGPFLSRIWRNDGTSIPVEINPRVINMDGRIFVQTIVRDVSERLRDEQRIAEISAERDRVLASLQLQFERMPIGCVVSSPDGRFRQVNPAFEQIFGYTAAEFARAEPFSLIVPAEIRDDMARRIAALAHAATPIAIVNENVTRSGRRITCRWTNTPLRDPGGSMTAILAMCEDITEQVTTERALRLSEERYRILAEVSPVGIFRADAKGRIVYVNRRACEISGLGAEQCLGEGWLAALHPDDYAALTGNWVRYRADESRGIFPMEYRVLRSDGTVRWVLPQVLPERDMDGAVTGYVGTITDITLLKQAQEELRDARDHLEQRVAERTRELEVARDGAERADRVKTAFLSTVSHELRTPLNSILGFTDVVLEGLSGPLTDAQRRQLTIVHDSSAHLRALIEDVLDISRIEAGQLSLEIGDVDLPDLLRRRVESFEPEVDRKRLELTIDVAPEVGVLRSDAKRVGQVLNNLLSNAVKFTMRGSVALEARVADGRVVVDVRDTGPGIAAADLDKLFKPFSQVIRPGGRLHEGTGLGLAISRQLARALGGDVTVKSEPDRGSTFTLHLPLVAPDTGDVAAATGFFKRIPAPH